MGSWSGKLLPIVSSIDNCQHQQAIETGRKASKTNDEEDNPEECNDDDVCQEEASQGSSSRSSNEKPNAKRKHVPTPASGQTESFLSEMKEAISTLKTLGADTSSKEVLDFLKE